MHLRQFIISGLILSGLVFIPHYALAAKSEQADHGKPRIAQTVFSEKVQRAMALENSNPVTSKPTHKSQGGVHQNPPATSQIAETKPIKPVTMVKKSAKQAKGIVHSSIKKAMNAHKPLISALNVKQKQPRKQKAVTKPVGKFKKHINIKEDSKVEIKSQSPVLKKKLEQLGESSNVSFSKKEAIAKTSDKKLPLERKKQFPSSDKKSPEASQAINPPPQRVQSSGGDSHDRIGTGSITLSFVDKWFKWDEHVNFKLSQAYVIRRAMFSNQWVNAPPSPPPKSAPFYLPYPVANSKDNDN